MNYRSKIFILSGIYALVAIFIAKKLPRIIFQNPYFLPILKQKAALALKRKARQARQTFNQAPAALYISPSAFESFSGFCGRHQVLCEPVMCFVYDY